MVEEPQSGLVFIRKIRCGNQPRSGKLLTKTPGTAVQPYQIFSRSFVFLDLFSYLPIASGWDAFAELRAAFLRANNAQITLIDSTWAPIQMSIMSMPKSYFGA